MISHTPGWFSRSTTYGSVTTVLSNVTSGNSLHSSSVKSSWLIGSSVAVLNSPVVPSPAT